MKQKSTTTKMQKEKPTQRIEQEATSYFKKGFFPRETCRTNFGE